MMRRRVVVALLAAAASACSNSRAVSPAEAQPGAAADQNKPPRADGASASCRDLPSSDDLKKWLRQAPGTDGEAGGLFSGKMEWGAVVDRNGEVCATAPATDDPASAWPGSQAIAKAKAYTANAYSTDDTPMSTARLYTLTQPGHSLWGVSQPNAFNPDCLVGPDDYAKTNGKVCGGQIAFGGGRRPGRQRRHGVRRS